MCAVNWIEVITHYSPLSYHSQNTGKISMYVGYEINKEYVELAEKRLEDFLSAQSQIKLTDFSS